MRLRRVVPRMVSGWKSFGTDLVASGAAGVPGEVMCWGVKYSRSGTPTLRSGGGAMFAAKCFSFSFNPVGWQYRCWCNSVKIRQACSLW